MTTKFEESLIESMDDAALKQYYSRHLRELVALERRHQILQGIIEAEVREANKRGMFN